VGSWGAHFDLPVARESAAVARAAASEILRAWGYRERHWLDQVAVVLSELVANAVRHAGGRLSVELRAEDGRVVVCVVDGSPAPPRRREPVDADSGDGGHGLVIVEHLSTAWRVEPHPAGKRVCAEFKVDVTTDRC
jgi:anti-sigma regulatory factor (Ser/Thr protein kinase)